MTHALKEAVRVPYLRTHSSRGSLAPVPAAAAGGAMRAVRAERAVAALEAHLQKSMSAAACSKACQ